MSYDIKGNPVKVKRTGDMIKVCNKNPHWAAALKYNHIRVQFPDKKEKSLLFTDHQLKRAIERADRNPEDLPNNRCWLTDIIEKFVSTDLADLQKVKNKDKHHRAADKYNHILVRYKGKLVHLLFTNNDIESGLKRAGRNPEDLPKVSWLTDILD